MESRGTKTALWLTVIGALIGGLLSTWIAPKAIGWYFTPPAQLGFNCAAPIEWALGKLQIAQAVGIVLGAAVGAGLFFGLNSRRKKRAAQAA